MKYEISYHSRFDLERKIRTLELKHPGASIAHERRLNQARATAMLMDNNGETVGETRTFALTIA